MSSKQALLRKVTWVLLGPDPELTTCKRCGETDPKPPLPIALDAFLHYLTYVLARHESCQEPDAP